MTANKAKNLSVLQIGDVDYPISVILFKAIKGKSEAYLPINETAANQLRDLGYEVEHLPEMGEYLIKW